MAVILLLATVVAALAIMGALAGAGGADSRDQIGDTRGQDHIHRSI